MLVIAGRELRSLFLSPLAWTLMAVVIGILAWVFLVLVEDFLRMQSQLMTLGGIRGVSDLIAVPLLSLAAWILLMVTPLLTMKLISDERRMRTLPLLLAAPVSSAQIVLGKYLAVLSFLLLIVGLIALMPLSLILGTDLDLGKLASGVLGLSLLVAGFAAVGLYFSSLTAQPVVAAATTLGLLILLWIIDSTPATAGALSAVFGYFSLLRHFEALLSGLFNSADVIFYLLFITFFLGLTIRHLDNQRLQH